MGSYFGTDGIRGLAGGKLSPELVLRAAFGLATLLPKRDRYSASNRPQVIIGCDSRLSSPMLKAAVVSGLTLGGVDAVDLGIVPTPVVPFTILKHGAGSGVMITASHNPVRDNGIKLFGADGTKLSTKQEQQVETAINSDDWLQVTDKLHFGNMLHSDISNEYLAFLRKCVRSTSKSRKLKVVLDCAAGATCALAPVAFEQAGYQTVMMNAVFDGAAVNVNSGATNLDALRRTVLAANADFGLGFDGDGDRVLAVDEQGNVVDGDRIIALMATQLKRYQQGRAIVMTEMSNLGVELALKDNGIKMLRADVGDIHVLRLMKRRGLHLGGEQSGHIIMRDFLPGGDGILAGLQLGAIIRSARVPLSKLAAKFPQYPQRLTNMTVSDKTAWQLSKPLEKSLKRITDEYSDVRIYLRPSGTENLVRVLTEERDSGRCDACNHAVCDALMKWDSKR